MALKVDQDTCESCQMLVKQDPPEKLGTCEFCGHLFKGHCTCSSAESMRDVVKLLTKYGMIVACF